MTKILFYEGIKTEIDFENTFLMRSDCTLYSARSGTELIEMAKTLQPNLICLEEFMPDMDGKSCLERLLGELSLTNLEYLVMIEGDPDDGLIQLAKKYHLALVSRPIEQVVLLRQISRLLNIAIRMAVRLKVVFEVKGKTAKNEIFYGKMIDLSTGGFLLEVEKSLSIGDILYCFFSLSKAEPLMFASGELVREAKSEKKNTHLYGLEFVNIRSDERKRIAEFIFGYSGEPEGDKDSPADLSLHPDGPEQL